MVVYMLQQDDMKQRFLIHHAHSQIRVFGTKHTIASMCIELQNCPLDLLHISLLVLTI
jgi:hypothetical protein